MKRNLPQPDTRENTIDNDAYESQRAKKKLKFERGEAWNQDDAGAGGAIEQGDIIPPKHEELQKNAHLFSTRTEETMVAESALELSDLPSEALGEIFKYFDETLTMSVMAMTSKRFKPVLNEVFPRISPRPDTGRFCAHAAQLGYLGLVQFGIASGFVCNASAYIAAASNNQLEILKYLFATRDPLNTETNDIILHKAATHGHYPVVEWLITHAEMIPTNKTLRGALKGGDVRTFELIMRLLPFDDEAIDANNDFCEIAAKRGHDELLKWLIEVGFRMTPSVFRNLIHKYSLSMLKFVFKKGCPVYWDGCYEAIQRGSFSVLAWLVEPESEGGPGLELFANSCEAAAETDQLDVLMWLREKDCPWNEATCTIAANYGNFDVLVWAIENGCPYNNDGICWHAAQSGNFMMMKWLVSVRGCQMDPSVISILAIHSNGLEMIRWAVANGCPETQFHLQQAVRKVARYNNNPAGFEWFLTRDLGWSTYTFFEKVYKNAAKTRNFATLRWAYERKESHWNIELYVKLRDAIIWGGIDGGPTDGDSLPFLYEMATYVTKE